MKVLRNALFVSWFGTGKKTFMSVDDIPIGKQVLVDCYEPERERESQTGSVVTRVTDAVINPNKWSKMDISSTIKATEHKTMAEIATELYSVLYVPTKDQLRGDHSKV